MTTITPLQRWTRDDWIVPCQVQDATGTAIDLTGYTIGGELWLSGYRVFQPLTVANGGILRGADAQGRFTAIAARLLTARAPGGLPADPTRMLLYWIDPLGRRQTLGAVPFEVFDGSEGRGLDTLPALTLVSSSTTLRLVVAASQGPPGPSQIAAAQVTDGTDVGRAVFKAADAAAVRAALGVPSIGRTPVSDVNYGVKASDTYVGIAALTAPRTVTLPPAAQYPPGQPLAIADESGACGPDRPILIAAAGPDSIAGQPAVTMQSPFQKAVLHANGTNLWTL